MTKTIIDGDTFQRVRNEWADNFDITEGHLFDYTVGKYGWGEPGRYIFDRIDNDTGKVCCDFEATVINSKQFAWFLLRFQ